MKFNDVQLAFLLGLKFGYQIAARETRRDVEDLVQELKDTNAEIRAELAFIRYEYARCQAMENAYNEERDPETRLNQKTLRAAHVTVEDRGDHQPALVSRIPLKHPLATGIDGSRSDPNHHWNTGS